MLALGGLSVVLVAREKESRSIKVVGVVRQVESARVIIDVQDGAELTLTPLEDFTNKLVVGSKVTAWYYVQGGVKILERLESISEKVSLPPPPTRSAPPPPQVRSSLPPAGIRISIKKIILLPSSTVPDADGVFEAIEKFLETNLGWYVAPRALAEEIRSRTASSSSMLEAINPETGEFDMRGYLSGQGNLITKLASETRVDAVLEVSVEEVVAKINRMVAVWDGAEEVIGSKGPRAIAKLAIVPGKGHVSASTVVLKLWDARGNLLWNNRRGFAALGVQEGLGGKLRYRPLSEYLQDSAKVEKWLTSTFGTLVSELSLGKSADKKPI